MNPNITSVSQVPDFATMHEYAPVGNNCAKIIASFTRPHLSPERVRAALEKCLGNGVCLVPNSFRWLDEDRTSALGYVYAKSAVEFLPEGQVPDNYRVVARNIYMDRRDESMWNMQDGGGGKYLVKQGKEDLKGMLAQARASVSASVPRMEQVQASVIEIQNNEVLAFVSEGSRVAELDFGVVLGAADGAALVLSHTRGEPITVKEDMVVQAFRLERASIPGLPRAIVDDYLAKKKARALASGLASDRVNAEAGNPNSVLTPEEYWKLQYSYAPDYLAKVLQQVNEMAAA